MRIRTIKPEYKKTVIPQAVRRAVAIAAGAKPGITVEACCAKCDARGSLYWCLRRDGRPSFWIAISKLEMDHVIPEYLGGKSTKTNIQLLCRSCNRKKGWRS